MRRSFLPGMVMCLCVLTANVHAAHVPDKRSDSGDFSSCSHGLAAQLPESSNAPETRLPESSNASVAELPDSSIASATELPESTHPSGLEHESEASQRVVQSRHTSTRNVRWYIGTSLGPAIPVGDYGDKSRSVTFRAHPRGSYTGMQIRLVNLGVFFTDRLGVAATVLGGANPVDLGGSNRWSYSGALIGPLFSFPVTHNVDWDVRPMIGYAVHTEDTIDEYPTSMAINVGSTFRVKVTDSFSLLAGLDYYLSNASFENPRFSQPVGTVSLDMGVAFTFR